MNIPDVIQELTHRIDVTQREAEIIVKATYEIIERALMAGESFEIRGFGTFLARSSKPCSKGNSRTAATQRVPYYRASKELKKFVNLKTPAPEK
jgi:nucleoid DNA-binding protein